jgi:hypothetical protein
MAHSSAKNPELALFIRRHNQLLTLAGALIVFVTFLVKEGKRESLKDLGDSVDASQSAFMIRNDSISTPLQLATIEEEINYILLASPRGSMTEGSRFFMLRRPWALGEGEAVLSRISRSLDNARRLSEKLPQRSELIEKRIHSLNNVIAEYQPDPSPKKIGVRLYSRQANFDPLWGLAEQVDALGNEILDDAEEVRVSTERSYAIYTWVSYGLYVLGWGLGLIGRLYGLTEDNE